MLIYKILTSAQWDSFEQTGRFDGAPIDLSDGYIHFSTASQMEETAAKHFAGEEGLVLAWAEEETFGDDLRWEASRGGQDFPHLYSVLTMDQIAGHARLLLIDGKHVFPKAAPE